jgi:hypothetical protein
MRYMKLAFFSILALALIAWMGPRLEAPETRRLPHGGIAGDRATDLAVLADESNLVFVGRVARVDYRVARGSPEDAGLPHAIVTYDISEVLRGQAPKTFTMRFIGGPDGRGRFLDAGGVPQFQPGDHDLLFVQSNGAASCPLVMCEWGRYRILRGGTYNYAGFPVRAVVKTHAIARGTAPAELLTLRYPAPRFDDLIRNDEVRALMREQRIPPAEMRRRYEAEAPKYLELVRVIPAEQRHDTAAASPIAGESARATEPPSLPEGPMAIEEFVATVKRIVAQVSRRPTVVTSIDPNAAIVVPSPVASAPRSPPRPTANPLTPTLQEAAELRAVTSQNFNPVIKR